MLKCENINKKPATITNPVCRLNFKEKRGAKKLLKINKLKLLAEQTEMCVCSITDAINIILLTWEIWNVLIVETICQ